MHEAVLLAILTLCLLLYLGWGFSRLPAERWQILAAVPSTKDKTGGGWLGINFTWYGLLTANAYLVAVLILLVLMGSIGIPLIGTVLLVILVLAFCVPASRLVARIVEKKAHTFTVGGAVFVGIVLTPLLIVLLNRTAGQALRFQIPLMAAYGAIAIAYAFGEGLGRLACISFGCCYGQSYSSSSPWLQRLFAGRCFVFSGTTKKIAYAGGMEDVAVIPIQAVTALLYTVFGLVSMAFYLASYHATAFLVATITTQGWRSVSETMRADYRGEGKISAYQVMGMVGCVYAVGAAFLADVQTVGPAHLAAGLAQLWNPAVIIFLQGLWMVIFIYTGRSTVTGATLQFHVNRNNI
jgi:hypothetical protein